MAVVINDFEVVVEQPPEAPAQGQQSAPAASGPTPQDIEQVVRRQMERAARVRAD